MKELTTTTRAGAGVAPAGEGHEITRTERSASPPARSGRTIAVYGATGYTGTMVARELVRRGVEVVLAGRSRDALAALAASFPSSARIAVAALDDPAALRAALSGCDAVVNAAGPFSRSTRPVLAAALAKHCHYLDVSADPYVLRDVFAEADQPGRNAGIAIVPGISFFFVLSDLLAQVVSEQATDRLTSVDVGYALERWHFTPGSMAAFWDMVGQRLRFFDGALRDTTDRPRHGRFAFASPIGDRAVVEYPGGDVVTIPRHVATPRVSVSMTAATFAPRWLSWALPVLMSLLGGLSRSRFRRSLQAIAERVPRRQIEERRAATRFAVRGPRAGG